jgi:hypothetical protein
MALTRRTLLTAGSIVFVFGGILGIGLLMSRHDPFDGRRTSGSSPKRTLKPGERVDLLSLVDVEANSVSGRWKLVNGILSTPLEPEARLEFPYAPPEEYDLKLVVVRRSNEHRSFHIGLVGQSRRFVVTIDGFGGSESALEFLDDKPSDEPGSVYSGWALKTRKPLAIDCSVRRKHLTVSVEGQKIIDWEADYARLSLPPHWKTPNDLALFVGSWKSRFDIQEATLTPVTGTGTLIED